MHILKKVLLNLLVSSYAFCSANLAAEPLPNALPAGMSLNSGSATATRSGSNLSIKQNTQVVDTRWTSFDIGRDASVDIRQPNMASTFIGRIGGSSATQIMGQLNANGRVVLTNPNGVVFGKGSSVNTSGIVASSRNLKGYSADGNSLQFAGGGSGLVRQEGVIQGEYVALIGEQIKQDGVISTTGDVALLAGETVGMTIGASGRLTVDVSAESGLGLIEQSGEIVSDDGVAIVKAEAAQSLLYDAIHSQSDTELVLRDGKLQLVNVAGDISAKQISIEAGDNGSAIVAGHLTAKDTSTNTGGQIDVLGGAVTIESGAILEASGENGGGLIQVGGSWQNSNPDVPQSLITRVHEDALLLANATEQGDGGQIVAWSDVFDVNSITNAAGRFEVNGGVLGGNGGRVETSGYSLLTDGISVEASSSIGTAGTWLLDPYNITISSATNNVSETSGSYTATAGSATIDVSDIATALAAGTNVTISTAGAGSDAGNIVWNGALDVTLNSNVSLILKAHGDITIDEKIEANSAGSGALNVTLNSNFGGGVNSNVVVNDYILSNGGDITIGGGTSGDGSGYVVGTGHAVEINQSIRSYGGDITIRGKSTTGSGDWAGVFVNSRQIYADAGQIAMYGQFNSYQGSGLRFDIDWNILTDGWVPSVGVPSGTTDQALRSVLYSASPLDNAVYLYGASNVEGNNVGDDQVSINFQYIGTMLTNRGGLANTPPIFASGGGNVLLETEELADYSDSRIRITNGVYVNGGEYHLYAPDGFASHSHWGISNVITSSTIGLDKLAGVYGNYIGTTGNPKTVIRTDQASTLSFQTRSSGDFSLYGYSNPDALSSDYTIGFMVSETQPVVTDITFHNAITNLRLTGGDVRLQRITADNVQVVAERIYVNDRPNYTYGGSVCGSSGAAACFNPFGTSNSPVATAYLKASVSIQDSSVSKLVYDGRMHVGDLILEAPLVELMYGGLGTDTYGSSYYGLHQIDRVAVSGTPGTVYLANSKALEIGTLSATAIDPSFSNALTVSNVAGIGVSDLLLVETSSGDLTVSAPISSSGTGDGSDVSYGDYYNYPIILNAGYRDSGHTDGSLVFSSSPSITVATGGRALLFTGGVDETTGISNYVGDGQSRYGAFASELSQPDSSTASYIDGLEVFDSTYVGIYREQPTISITPNSPTQTIVYGGSIDTTTSASGFAGVDTAASVLSGSVAYSVSGDTSTSGNYVVGDHTLSFSGLSNSVGYLTSYTDGSITVTAKPLTVSYSASAKTYDGGVTATVAETITGRVGSDVVVTQETAVFDGSDVAYASGSVTSETISISSVQLAGTDSANYSLAVTSYSSSAQINPKTVTVSGTRVYDGQAIFSASDLNVTTGIQGQSLTLSGSATANATSVTSASYLSDVSSLTLADGQGGTAANYVLSTGQDNLVSVTPRTVGLSFSRTYNAKLAAAAADFTVTTGVLGESLTISGAGTLDSSNVSTVTGLSSYGDLELKDGTGGAEANYTLPSISAVSASLTPYQITGAPNTATKIYDGTSDDPSGTQFSYEFQSLPGYAGLNVKYAYTDGSFNSANVASASQFTYTGGAISSVSYPTPGNGVVDETPLVSDFSIASTASVSGTITPYTIRGTDIAFAVTGNPTTATISSSDAYAAGGSPGDPVNLFGEAITFEVASGLSLTSRYDSQASNFYMDNDKFAGATISSNGNVTSNYQFITDTSYSAKNEYQIFGTREVLSIVPFPNGKVWEKEYDGTNSVESGFFSNPEYYDWNTQDFPQYWVVKNETTGDLYTPAQIGATSFFVNVDGSIGQQNGAPFYSGLDFDAVYDGVNAGDADTRKISISNVQFQSGGNAAFEAMYLLNTNAELPAIINKRSFNVAIELPEAKYYDGTADFQVKSVSVHSDGNLLPADVGKVSLDVSELPSFALKQTVSGDPLGSTLISIDRGYKQGWFDKSELAIGLSGEAASNYAVNVGVLDNGYFEIKPFYNYPNALSANLSIIPRPLTLTSSKVYDGSAVLTVDDLVVETGVSGETLSVSRNSITGGQIRSTAMVDVDGDGVGDEVPDSESLTHKDAVLDRLWDYQDQFGALYADFNALEDIITNGVSTSTKDAVTQRVTWGQYSTYAELSGSTDNRAATDLARVDARISSMQTNAPDAKSDVLSNLNDLQSRYAQIDPLADDLSNVFNTGDYLKAFNTSTVAVDAHVSDDLVLMTKSSFGFDSLRFESPDSSANLSNYCAGVGCFMSIVEGSVVYGNTQPLSELIDQESYNSSYVIAGSVISPRPISASILSGPAEKKYDGTVAASDNYTPDFQVSGGIAGDDISVAYSLAAFDDPDIGEATSLAFTGLSIDSISSSAGSLSSDYVLTTSALSVVGSIIPDSIILTLSGYALSDKTYDGTSLGLASLMSGGSLVGITSGHSVSLDTSSATLSYAQDAVGTGIAVTVGGLALSGSDASEYSIADVATTGNIVARPITITADAGQSKVYGESDPVYTYTPQANGNGVGLVNGDTFTGVLSRATGENVGSYALTQNTLDNANYDITFVANDFVVNKKALTAVATVAAKTYNGSNSASVTLSLNGLVNTEDLGQSVTATFDSTNAGLRTASIDSFSLSDGTSGLAGNYRLAANDISFTNNTATISEKPLTASGVVSGKTYDGSSTASVALTLSGYVGNETLGSSASATFGSANAGTQTATVNSVSLSDGSNGGLGSNYSLALGDITLGNSGNATISQKALTATASVSNKTYDGSDSASVTLSLNGLVNTEDLGQSVTASFDSANAGSRTASIDSFSLSDGTSGLAGNYSLVANDISFTNNTATIAKKTLTIASGSATASNKVYDGTSTAVVDLSGITWGGLVPNDSLGTASGSFANKNVGTNKSITVSFSGGDGGNYTVPTLSGVTADITARPISISGITASNKFYDGNVNARINTSNASGWIVGDEVSVNATGQFVSSDVGSNIKVVLSAQIFSGADVGNYLITDQPFTFADITTQVNEVFVNRLPLKREQLTLSTKASVKPIDLEKSITIVPTLRSLSTIAEKTLSTNAPVVFTNTENASIRRITIPSTDTFVVATTEEGDEIEVPIEEFIGLTEVPTDHSVSIHLPDGRQPEWASFDRGTQKVVAKVPMTSSVNELRIMISDSESNGAAFNVALGREFENINLLQASIIESAFDTVKRMVSSIQNDVNNEESASPSQIARLVNQRFIRMPGFLSVESLRPVQFRRSERFVYEVPQGTFTHENEDEPLKFRATLADGSALPSWLVFNPETQTFSGEAPQGQDTVELDVIVTATDSASQEAQVQMKIKLD